jgi:hypothetical protein
MPTDSMTAAKLTHAPCIGGPLDGNQVPLSSGEQLMAREGGTTYRYLMHKLRGETSELYFYALDTMSVDHALSHLLRGYRPNA